MKGRDYKEFAPQNCYHVYNRGNNKKDIFLSDSDYIQFLKRLKLALGLLPGYDKLAIEPFPVGSFSMLAYCLMPNHYHFLVRQNSEVPLDKLIRKVCTSYAMYFNKKYEQVGHLFQGIYKAKLVDSDAYLTTLSAYIHLNPASAFDYPYSSLQDYLGLRAGQICDKDTILGVFQNDSGEYRKFIESYNDQKAGTIQHLLFSED